MLQLNLPIFEPKLKKIKEDIFIFDLIRKKYLLLTPEEWVRQSFLNYLINHKGYPFSLMENEAIIQLNNMTRRCDTVVYNNLLEPLVIIEYKRPDVKIDQQVFDQIVRYNIVLRVKFLIISNGVSHYCCKINYENQTYDFLESIPDYSV
ncbi:MAG: type I restriction enzyme HsdR N-terminal domain-containing protein, partial [Dysgonamonadaceae bacterium]|nr:type I restriction enzyme HsdR N-terminal domain-containing protein [Dysgonamonadaceae bacterium]